MKITLLVTLVRMALEGLLRLVFCFKVVVLKNSPVRLRKVRFAKKNKPHIPCFFLYSLSTFGDLKKGDKIQAELSADTLMEPEP